MLKSFTAVVSHSRNRSASFGWIASITVIASFAVAAGVLGPLLRSTVGSSTDDGLVTDGGPSSIAATQDTDESRATLACRIVDSSGQPIVGATVEVVHVLTSLIKSCTGAGAYYQVGARVHQPVERTVAEGETDENGEFVSTLSRGRAFEVRCRAEGRVATVETNRYAGERVEVVLYRPGVIEGHVRSSFDQTPITSGRVCLSRRGPWYWTDEGAVDISADGTYRAVGLQPGWYTVRAEWKEAPSDGFDVPEGGVQAVDVNARPPTAGHSVTPDDPTRIRRAPSAATRTVRGRVLGPDGEPAGEVYVAAVFRIFGIDTGTFELRETKSLADGSFELAGLDAGKRHTLCAWREDCAPLFFDMPAEERSKNEWDVGALAFARASSLAGTVVASDGSPLPGVALTLSGLSEPQKEPPLTGPDGKRLRYAMEYSHFRDARSLHADENGRFVVIDLAPGRYSLRFGAKRLRNDVTREVVVEAAETELGPLAMPANFLDANY